jgi:hypothetical protein
MRAFSWPRRTAPLQATLCRWTRSRSIAVALGLLSLVCPHSCNAEGADGQDYLPLGPHFFASASTGGPLNYRDIILSTAPSASETVGATYGGFSVSFWNGTDLTDSGNHAFEALGTYSHKLPLVDLHLGGYWCSTSGSLDHRSSGIRFSATSNTFRSAEIGLTFDQSFNGRDRTLGASGTKSVYHKGAVTVDLKASGTHWNYSGFSAGGISGRVMITDQLSKHAAIHFFLGGIGSRVTRSEGQQSKGALIAGATISWSF